MVMEKYFHGNTAERNFDVRSVTKSVSSILTGIAIDKGFIKSVDQPISEFLGKVYKDLPAEKGKITIRDLLTMSSGLPWLEINSAQQDYMPWVSSPNQLRWILDKPYEYAPGMHWNYNTGASHILSVVLQEATGMTAKEFAQKYLFDPIGSQLRYWCADKQGYYYGGHGICLDGRTMIKIGRMFLDNGKYNGRQVISSSWVEESVKSKYPTNNALPCTDGYGYLWWTGKDIITGLSYFMAIGYGGQFIVCVPSKNTVIATGTEWCNFPMANQNWYFVLLTIMQKILPAL
jgi:CubicO group peptidase (beta-lactamase class C family)